MLRFDEHQYFIEVKNGDLYINDIKVDEDTRERLRNKGADVDTEGGTYTIWWDTELEDGIREILEEWENKINN